MQPSVPTNLASFFFQQVREAEEQSDRIHEAVIGVVVDNKDPDKLSRVKVKFPSLPGQDTSWWAPLSALGAGAERGWYFLPEIDDEVLVMFEHGDIRRPVVIGALWNGKDAPSDSNGGANERRCIVSRQGSKITFDDDQGTVTFEDGTGHGKVTISKDNKITIESATGDVCMYAPAGELNIAAKELTMTGSQNLHIETASGINMGSDAKITIKGGSLLQVQASKLDINPGGVSAPAETQDSCEEVPDPLGG